MFIYLASPYTPMAGEDVEARVEEATKFAAGLMKMTGQSVFSPIVHSHYIADHMDPELRFDHEFWMQQDLGILRQSAKVIVLMLDGWEASRGIAREIQEATELGIPIEYVEPDYIETYPRENGEANHPSKEGSQVPRC